MYIRVGPFLKYILHISYFEDPQYYHFEEFYSKYYECAKNVQKYDNRL